MKGEAGERVLGRYRLEHPIGEGGFGRIFLGRQVALDREVAIKASRPGRRDDDGLRERFRREALLVAGINHPNVVTYHDFGVDDDGDLVLVMEHLKGCCLLDVLRRGRPVPLADVARWMAEAAAGLNEAHARGLVHRDVKPSNLFLVAPGTRSERMKVIDFGILLADPRAHPGLQDLTRSDAFVGTPEYVAPEMMLGRGLDGRADQYALALVTFELISGRRPFPPADEGGLLLRLSERPGGLEFRETGRRVPAGVSAALWRALSPSPGERYPTITEFADALRHAVEGFDEDGHGDRTRVGRDAATEPTRTMDTQVPEGPGNWPRTLQDLPRPGTWLRRGAWVVAGILAATLGALAAGGMNLERSGTETGSAAVVPDGLAVGDAAGPVAVPETVEHPPAPDAAAVAPEVIPERPTAPIATRPAISGGSDRRDRKVSVGGTATLRPSSGDPAPPTGPAPAAASVASPPAEASPRGQALLVLNAWRWAEVFLDGRSLGRTPVKVPVPPGTWRIEFRHPTLGTRVETRTVAAGAKETVFVRFEEPGEVRPSATP